MRFSIRDVLWLTVVVGMLTAWLVDRSQLAHRLRPWAEWEQLMNDHQLERWAGVIGKEHRKHEQLGRP